MDTLNIATLFFYLIFSFFFASLFFKKILPKKPLNNWGDILLSLTGALIYYYVSFLFVTSHAGPFLGELVPLLISGGISIVFMLVLLWQALKNKRYGLLAPIVLSVISYALISGYQRYEVSQRITYSNFSEKLPALSQAITNGDVVAFKKEIDNYTGDLKDIDHILYYKCVGQNQADICEVLLRKKLLCSSYCFEDLILRGLDSKKNKFTELIPLLNQLILESKNRETLMKDFTQELTGKNSSLRLKYLQTLLTAIGEKPIMIPMDYLKMYLSSKDPESFNVFLKATKLIINNKSNFFKDAQGLNDYKLDIKKHISLYIENDWKIKQSFIDDLNTILQSEY